MHEKNFGQEKQMSWFPICSLDELKQNKVVTQWSEEIRDEITVLYQGQELLTFSSICPHQGGDFNFNLKKNTATCKWHGMQFCLKSLECTNRPVKLRLQQYENRITNGIVEVYAE